MKILLNNNDLIRALYGTMNLGFVPTMGSLHQGHISLIKRSLKDWFVSNSKRSSCLSFCCAASLEKIPNPDDPYIAVVAIPTCRKSRRDNINFLSKV